MTNNKKAPARPGGSPKVEISDLPKGTIGQFEAGLELRGYFGDSSFGVLTILRNDGEGWLVPVWEIPLFVVFISFLFKSRAESRVLLFESVKGGLKMRKVERGYDFEE